MTRRRRQGRGALGIVAILLACGGALRLGDGIGSALAQVRSAQPAATSAASCPAPPVALAAALSSREEKVKADEAAIAQREAALALANQAISKRLGELQAAEDQLKRTVSIANGASEKDLAQLTAVYAAMKPADAAKLFNQMDPAFSAGFLARMQPQAAAAILAGMTEEAAYSVSALIAGRNAKAPKH